MQFWVLQHSSGTGYCILNRLFYKSDAYKRHLDMTCGLVCTKTFREVCLFSFFPGQLINFYLNNYILYYIYEKNGNEDAG